MSSIDAFDTRATPVQQRGVERVDKLLYSAARIVHERGIAQLTTSSVAEASGSSVGVVYRYFPNVDALLLALAERNQRRFLEILSRRSGPDGSPDWRAFVKDCIDTYAELIVDEPGFAELRFGDVITVRFGGELNDVNEVVRARLVDVLVGRYGFAPGDDLLFHAELTMECVDAITRRAVFRDRDNEDRFFDAAYRIAVAVLLPTSPGGHHVDVPGIDPL